MPARPFDFPFDFGQGLGKSRAGPRHTIPLGHKAQFLLTHDAGLKAGSSTVVQKVRSDGRGRGAY